MVNNSDVPIEVYSVDFDEQYKEEEALLQALDCSAGPVAAAVRSMGKTLPDTLIGLCTGVATDSEKDIADKYKQLVSSVRNVVVMGAPYAGTTSTSTRLASLLGLQVPPHDTEHGKFVHCVGV